MNDMTPDTGTALALVLPAAAEKAEADARAKREADQAHRDRIEGEIATDLNGFIHEGEARLIAAALMKGDIRNCEVRI